MQTQAEKFQQVFDRLLEILKPYEPHLLVKAGLPDRYSLDAPYSEKYKREVFFGAVEIRKRYVSFYLMPVYVFPDLLEGLPDRLKKRMQGKSCFNFNAIDEESFAFLQKLAERGFERYQSEGLV